MTAEMVKHFTLCHILSDKQHGFSFDSVTTDVLKDITEILCHGLDENGEARAEVQDNLKPFDRV